MKIRSRSGEMFVMVILITFISIFVIFSFLKLWEVLYKSSKNLDLRGERESLRHLIVRNLSCSKTLNPLGVPSPPNPPTVCDPDSDGVPDAVPLRKENGDPFLNPGDKAGKWTITAKCAPDNSGATTWKQFRIAATIPGQRDLLTQQDLVDTHPQAALFSYGTEFTCREFFGGTLPLGRGFNHLSVFNTPGDYPFQLPSGTLSTAPAFIEVWGAGGGGGGASYGSKTGSSASCPSSPGLPYYFGSGGGGGGYAAHYASLDPNVVYSVSVGSGGSGGAFKNGGVAGGPSSFSVGEMIVAATGGAGGNTRCNNNAFIGGTRGYGSQGTLLLGGSEGGLSVWGTGFSMGGNGARSGSAGGRTCGSSGAVGGGGGAPACNSNGGAGGSGGHGTVAVHW